MAIKPVVTIKNTTTQLTWVLRLGNESQLRQMYQVNPTGVGRPVAVAIVPVKGTGPTQGSRSQLYIYPITDQEYTFQLPYYINPDYLNGAFPFPYGGAQHAETIRSACLAAAEETLDDAPSVWRDRFAAQLQASINVDRRSKPQMVGYNGDNSDERGRWRRGDWHGWGSITVNGVAPGGPPY